MYLHKFFFFLNIKKTNQLIKQAKNKQKEKKTKLKKNKNCQRPTPPYVSK